MALRQFTTEMSWGYYSDGMLLIHAADVAREVPEKLQDLVGRCHIYLIVTRPRVTYTPSSIKQMEGYLQGKFSYRRAGAKKTSTFRMIGTANADRIELSKYPHSDMNLIRDDEVLHSIPAHAAAMLCNRISDKTLRDLKVRYVGMAFGDGGRSAKDRLESHSTLQQILADLNREEPDEEVLLLMVEFASPQAMMLFDGTDPSLNDDDDHDPMLMIDQMLRGVDKETEVCLIEAGLIRYFKPDYNDQYREAFPLKRHKILAQLYSIDIAGLVVEIGTKPVNARLFSDHRPIGWHHIANFDLHDPAGRKSFFNLGDLERGSNAADVSGPVF